MTGRALVLGAGIQGSCVALGLAQAGWSVELVDRASTPMAGASGHGEGKVHLGLVYGNEPSRRTASLMIDGALSFGPILDRLAGRHAPIDWRELRSTPFAYAVLPGSLVDTDVLREHYSWVEERVREAVHDGATYLGRTPTAVVEEVPAHSLPGIAGPLDAAFRTAEVAVDPRRLGPIVTAALAAEDIAFVAGHTVMGVTRTPSGLEVESRSPEGTHRRAADLVVNCLWDGRLAIDATLGVDDDRPVVHRFKCGVTGALPAEAPPLTSCTFVLGPFGDVVQRADGDVYASWYPSAVVGWSTEVQPPPEWASPSWLDERAGAVAEVMLRSFAALVPSLAELTDVQVGGGVIVAWGETDIDHRESGLHHRHEVGVHLHDGYVSIDTGKLTVAPLFAQQLLDAL